MTATAATRDDAAVFADDIAAWALAERVAPLLAPDLKPAIAERLLRSETLRAPCSAWLVRTLGPLTSVDGLEPDEKRLVLAPGTALKEAARLAGAVWHARRICALVLAADITAFVAVHGRLARDVAVRHLALTPLQMDPSQHAADDLAEAIAADGRASVAAWIDQLPPPIAGRLRLKRLLTEETTPHTEHQRYGPLIVRAIASTAVEAVTTAMAT